MSDYTRITDRKIELTDEGVEELMTDYTPSTEEVRNLFSWDNDEGEIVAKGGFDRWLAEVKADAWEEGWVSRNKYLSHFENPYREGENSNG